MRGISLRAEELSASQDCSVQLASPHQSVPPSALDVTVLIWSCHCAALIHGMKANGGRGGRTPRVFDYSTKSERLFSFAPKPLYPVGRGSPVPIRDKTGWVPGSIWTQQRRGKYLSPLGVKLRQPIAFCELVNETLSDRRRVPSIAG